MTIFFNLLLYFKYNLTQCPLYCGRFSLGVLELPPEHRRRLRTTNAVERMHEEIKRRTQPIRIFPNRNSVFRMVTTLWQDIHKKWLTGRKYLEMDVINEWETERELVSESETTNGVNGNSQKM